MPDRIIPPDPYDGKMGDLEDTLLHGPGKLDFATRATLAAGGDVPEPLSAYATKVTRYAYRVTDEDIAALKAAGYTEDQIFEATLAVAFGAARQRFVAGKAALYADDSVAPTSPANSHDASDAGAASADVAASDDPNAARTPTSEEGD